MRSKYPSDISTDKSELIRPLVEGARKPPALGEQVTLGVRQQARAIGLLGLQAATGRAAGLRIALDQRDEAVVGKLLVLCAQASPRRTERSDETVLTFI